MKDTSANETKEPKLPADLKRVLTSDPVAEAMWQGLTPLSRRDFLLWINAAKQDETRKRRIDRVPSMLKTGKRRPCCFTIVPTNFYKALEANPKAKAQWKDLDANERRDLVSWIDAVKEPAAHKDRAVQACAMLAVGKRQVS